MNWICATWGIEQRLHLVLIDSKKVSGSEINTSDNVFTAFWTVALRTSDLKKLAGYIERNRDGIWYDEARENGISIGAGSVDKAGDILICRQMKLRGMRWSRKGADAVLSIRILVCNGGVG